MTPRRLDLAGWAVVGALALCAGCGSEAPAAPNAPVRESAPAIEVGRLHALLLNGGGRPEINNYSHLEHLRRLTALLDEAGVERTRVTIFSGDGASDALDLATREGVTGANFWLFPSQLAANLRPPVELVDSRIAGHALRPARIDALGAWFTQEGAALAPGDTLLLYVTDHGEGAKSEADENTITLWGEKLRVSELRAWLAGLAPGVRVVMLMSQCYSGGFAEIALGGDAVANACGFFSTTHDRKAHGCYPEVSGKPAVGHSHRFLSALRRGIALSDAHRETLALDDSPDVPLATSALLLERELARAAEASGQSVAELADVQIRRALRNPAAIERDLRDIDRVASAYGFAAPRALADVEAQQKTLDEHAERLESYEKLWETALDALRAENLNAFLAAQPEWNARTAPSQLASAEAKRRVADELGAELARFARESGREARLRDLRRKAEDAKAASYRADVRLAAALRLRGLLLEIAGAQWLAGDAPEHARTRYMQLAACENVALGGGDASLPPEAPAPFPTLAEEQRTIRRVLPGWLGIQYRPPRTRELAQGELPRGAAVVSEVFPDGPAARAGVEPGDILLGPPGEPFAEPHAIREWTMQGEIGGVRALELLRNGEPREAEIQLAAYPLEKPRLPGPPEVGAPAPKLAVEMLDGAPLAAGKPHLLFFWATWCGHCKHALPALDAFTRETGVQVLAISDEEREDIERFRREYAGALPRRIAVDPNRKHFRQYGVSGTPTFVLVDARGAVRQVHSGYDASKGIEIDVSAVR